MNDDEKKHGTLPVITAKTQEGTVTVIKGKGRKQLKTSYSFDGVFTAFSTQDEVFDATVKPVIMDVMRGFESTVFAYGQTGTGKTHTSEYSDSGAPIPIRIRSPCRLPLKLDFVVKYLWQWRDR
jgi:kinesin family protein 11